MIYDFIGIKFQKVKKEECLPTYDELIERVCRNRNYCENNGYTVDDVLTCAELSGADYVNMTGEDIGVYTKAGRLMYILPMSGITLTEDNMFEAKQYSHMKLIVNPDVKTKCNRNDFVTITKPVMDGDKIIGVLGIRALK